jgi:pre-mRNA-splicing factor ATP-dependent RNA helicase DHX15/PRP43
MMEKQGLTVSNGTTKEIMDATEGLESDMKTCVRKALVAGFFPQTAFCQGKHFITEQDMKPVTIHPGSCLKHKPEWILYHELVLTKESYVRNVSAIRPEWLIEMVPQHFPENVRNEDMVRSLKRAKERFERELRSKGLMGGA